MSVDKLSVLNKEPRFIVVEGPIGVGKTSLARRLAASLSAQLVLEQTGDNPFLERFYKTAGGALPTQLFYLFQRAKQLEELRQSDLFSPIRVANFHISKDRLFAEVSLDREELALYEQMHAKMDIDPPVPDLVIYLQASADVLLNRIARRAIPHEKFIERHYLEKITEAYSRYYHSYDESPLLIVNASSMDAVNNEADYAPLFERVCTTTSGRHFFNPTAAAAFI